MCLVKAADNPFARIATMKPIHVMGLILIPAFAIVWCFQIWSARQWKTELVQAEADGSFYENRRMIAKAKANVREAFNESSIPVNDATGVSGSSWEDPPQNVIIDSWVRAIKSFVHSHRPRPAPPGVYFTLTYLSVRNPSGITGLEAGSRVICVKDEGPVLLVKAGNVEFEANRQYLTNDLNIADLAVRNDAEAQQAVAPYIAKQQRLTSTSGKNPRQRTSVNLRLLEIARMFVRCNHAAKLVINANHSVV